MDCLRRYRRSLPFLTASREDIEAHQMARLRDLLAHAGACVPYYRDLFRKERFEPSRMRTVRDLEILPPLRRRDLQGNRPNLLAEGADTGKLARGSSSGSTGEPVVFFHDRDSSSEGVAAGWAGWHIGGWRPGARYFHLWGNPSSVASWSRWSSRLKYVALNWDRYPAHELTNRGALDLLFGRLGAFRPEFLGGYAHAISRLAFHAKESGGYPGPRLKGVFTTAEQLHPLQRSIIEDALGPVFDAYGCAEVNGIANQCAERSGYHVHAYHVILEILREDGLNKILLTDLGNRSFPLIRYQVGDLMAQDALEWGCPCGVTLPTLAGIQGRESDSIATEEGGALLVPSFLGGKIFEKIHGVRAHQVVLTREGVFAVKLVLDRDLAGEERRDLEAYLRSFLGARPWRIDILPDEGDLTYKAGKFRIFCREDA
jgi:phenylacetate-CoA ligase